MDTSSQVDTSSSPSFLARHEFLIRRLHSLSGMIPVGAYMVVHLVANASILNSSATFQNAVYQIHSLGDALVVVEWVFIFIPILFHAIFGVVIIRGGLPNYGTYKYGGNLRYTLQRVSGMVAFLFIMLHVFHMHGWFHWEVWLQSVAEPLGGAQFRPYNAASTGGAAMQGTILIPISYAIGVLACVFHLANGLWTMGITWGVWTSPNSQRRANWLCLAFGLGLAAVSLGAIRGFTTLDVEKAEQIENEMYEAKLGSHEIMPNEHKRADRKHKQEQASHQN